MQVCAVLCYAQQNNVEPFLEPVLQLAHAMMLHDTPAATAGGGTPSSSGQILEVFLTQLLTFADLCSHSDPAAALAAAQCVAQLVGLCCYMVDQSASCAAHKARPYKFRRFPQHAVHICDGAGNALPGLGGVIP